MRKLLYLFAFILCTIKVQAQNLVFNGDFEAYNTCPTALGLVTNCYGWWQFTSGSSDYLNCGLVPSTPNFGYQQAYSGSAYMGGFASLNDTQTTNTYKEYIAGMLTPMVMGGTYQVSLLVNLADKSKFGTDDIGVYFFKNGPTIYSTVTTIPPVTPQVTFASFGPVGNTQNWVRLSGSFYADSAYDKIVIGSWKEAANSNHVAASAPTGADFAYYFYDSIIVSITSKITTSYSDSLLCTGASMTVPYTVHSPGYFQSNNIFTLQLSNAAGSFANPTILATQAGTSSGSFTLTVPNVPSGTGYRVRVVSSAPADMSNESHKAISIGNTIPAKPVITVTNPCLGQSLNLSCAGTSGATYKWTGPAAFNANVQNPVINNVTLAANGNYYATAWLYGCPSRDTETVTVKQSPAPFTAFSNSPVCNNSTLTLTASNSTAGCVYSWVGPNAFTSNTKINNINNITLAGTGNYIITATLDGCSLNETVSVTVMPTPMNVSATANTPVCDGHDLNLFVTNSTPGVSYNWTGPNSFGATAQNPVISTVGFLAAGDYIVELSINGCVKKDTVTVIVNPTPAILTAGSNTPVCNGNKLNLYATNSLPGATYNWTGPSFASNQQNPSVNNVNPGMAGAYTVSASLNGCTSVPTNTNVTILYFPSSVTAYILPEDTICTGSSIQLIAVANNGGTNPQFQWMKNGFVIPGATAISYTTASVATGDKFSVELTPDNTCPSPDTSTPVTITVLPWVATSVSIAATPGTLISPWQTVTFKATPVNGGKNPTYQWKRNGQDVVGAVNDIWGAYTLSNNDTISVVMYSSEYCPSPATATSNSIIINVKLGVDEVDNANGFVLYPNPNNGSFTLKGNVGSSKPIVAEVWNTIGQLVYRHTLQPGSGVLNSEMNLDKSVAAGVYLLKLQTEESTEMIRFTISK